MDPDQISLGHTAGEPYVNCAVQRLNPAVTFLDHPEPFPDHFAGQPIPPGGDLIGNHPLEMIAQYERGWFWT